MSIYKRFRTVDQPRIVGELSYIYDQPTYMTFKLDFATNRDANYNDAGKQIQPTLNYDTMPHPLFAEKGSDNVDERETYSAIDYLYDANEYTRAEMLKEFISKINELQTKYQWYFKSIDGLEDILKINPEYGQRVPFDKRLTIHMMEGLDLRISHILSLYRKIAWDDMYQRWVLPEMMRYFTLKIYITEFRTFHFIDPLKKNSGPSSEDLVLSMLDNVLPTWVIECEMCEFDIESIKYDYLSSLNVHEDPQEAGLSFSIKVGKVYESQVYNLFKNSYLVDKNLNGFDRLNSTVGEAAADSTSPNQSNNYIKNLYAGRIAQNSIEDSSEELSHVSGLPFNQGANTQMLINSANTSKNTWVSNALTSGLALAKNYVNEQADKLKMTAIPKLGFSVTDLASALEAKNVFTTLGLIRQAISTVKNDTIDPSEKLSSTLVDTSFKSFLEELATSTATSHRIKELSSAANLALNDRGVWDALKDYSIATDMVANGEVNIINKIEGENTYKNEVLLESENTTSKATDYVEGTSIQNSFTPISTSSMATTNKLVL